jgi:cell division septation protein DedD
MSVRRRLLELLRIADILFHVFSTSLGLESKLEALSNRARVRAREWVGVASGVAREAQEKLDPTVLVLKQRAQRVCASKSARQTIHILSIIRDRISPLTIQARDLGIEALRSAGNRPQVTVIGSIVILPLAAFLGFAFARYVSDDGFHTFGAVHQSGIGRPLSEMLVEPPSVGSAATVNQPAVALPHEFVDRWANTFDTEAVSDRSAWLQPMPDTPRRDFQPVDEPWQELGTVKELTKVEESSAHSLSETEDSPSETSLDTEHPSGSVVFSRPLPKPVRGSTPISQITSMDSTPAPNAAVEKLNAASAGTYQVQLLALGAQEEALQAWDKLNRKHGDVLGNFYPIVSPRKSRGRRVIYRLRAGPMYSKNEAQAICAQLAKRRVDCLVILASS